jgi:lysozyme
MPTLVPLGKPRLSTDALLRLLQPFNVDRETYPLVVVGVRGYYRNSMGAPGVNDRGIYDDAMFLHTPSVTAAFNANTDPSSYRPGTGSGSKKGMACLTPGVWYVHRFDLHRSQYLALCQRAGTVTVTRDGNPPYDDIGHFGINIHRGSYRGTSSLGCQTIHPSQWDSFISLAVDQAHRYYGARWKLEVIPYILVAQQ